MDNYLATHEYLEFLKKNCGVRGYDFEERSPDCARADVDVILRYLKLLRLSTDNKLLEIGCGVGRIIKEVYDAYGVMTYGVDTSPEIISAASQRVASIASDLRVSLAEKLGYESNFFDKVLCWGVFDLTNQDLSLMEMCRVTKPGGLILLTGKNDNYHDDDHEAYTSEKDYRGKGIPNHFTDFEALIALAKELGLKRLDGRFFHRRGDIMTDVVDYEVPARFYEYLLLFRKDPTATMTNEKRRKIGSLMSKTYLRIKASSAELNIPIIQT